MTNLTESEDIALLLQRIVGNVCCSIQVHNTLHHAFETISLAKEDVFF